MQPRPPSAPSGTDQPDPLVSDDPVDCTPVAHLAVVNDACRAAVTRGLHELGWACVHHPTGLHLVEAMAGLILGDGPVAVPDLIVVDEWTSGCQGASIADGLRDLGFLIPTILLVRADAWRDDAGDRGLVRVEAADAARVVATYARALTPAPARATA